MRNIFLVAILFISLCIPHADAAAYSESPPVGLDAGELESFFDGWMPAQMNAFHVPGGAVSVVQDGKLLFAKGYGYADVSLRTPVVAESTLFRLASVSSFLSGRL